MEYPSWKLFPDGGGYRLYPLSKLVFKGDA